MLVAFATADPVSDPYYGHYGHHGRYNAATAYPYYAAYNGYVGSGVQYHPNFYQSYSNALPSAYYSNYRQSDVPSYYPYAGPAGRHGPHIEGSKVVRPEGAPHSVAAVPEVGHETQHVTATQYHAQDEDGNYSFGYRNPNGARHETGNPYTGITG